LIGDAGYAGIANAGFHSQAGWIAFNLAAFSIAIVAKHSPWLNRRAGQPARVSNAAEQLSDASEQRNATADNPVAPYLMPFLAIIAIGMLTRAFSAGFDVAYPLRLAGAAAVLWSYRYSYRTLDWRFSWRAVWAGALIFIAWGLAAKLLTPQHGMPDALAQMSAPARLAWIACRIGAAAMTVPIAEELAFRGYLMRRLTRPDFNTLSFRAVRWPALMLSAAAFGLTHGALWFPGMIAGLIFGLLAIKTGKIGEAVAAHAVTNTLLAAYVLSFDQWQLW
jgi:exosortase E/protease (VPEID-CTERM system)